MSRIPGTDVNDEVLLRATQDQIEQSRERLVSSMGALKNQLSDLGDWREWVRQRPLTFVGGALALGLFLGMRR